ncbi:uncharacterized protein HMPREF1541_04996 [Cyphellophora europaea CBS 101466]|uniref:Uncharacterized protein n=1 Tax=Cyphellophora europaea (strain CBS 101466) TaxID=1220924 RepID=W2RW15_CYPE1|nr:uncharacterized protein HMPREF1541_04996 [Cyphellophora europaea CBS 101466]ETN40716.1 hypothetical protein HMPREF1541_04996 [Cyphellophora europaea CBS 101466]
MTMIAIIKNKTGLALDTTPKIHKKYLGEPDDPHFIPDSPLIERAQFTEQEEGELKRLCALALAHVPHSDEPDPAPPRQPQPQAPRKYKTAAREDVKPPQPQYAETRTPSEASKRDTVGTATDYSTPLTSAGITPGETVKRNSDNNNKASSSSKGITASNLRFDSWQQAYQRAKAHSHPPPSKALQPVDPRKVLDARKSSASAPVGTERALRFATESPRGSTSSQPNPARSTEFPRSNRYSQAELNKKLPPLPKEASGDDPQKSASLSRMFKTISRKKSTIHGDDEEDCEPLTGSDGRISTPVKHVKSAPVSPAVGADSKKKLASKLKIFGRKERPEISTRGITVS